MSRLIAGSPQAIAWGKRMQKIRRAGLQTEKKFFGPRGVFVKAGHVQHLRASPNPITLNPPKRIHTTVAGILYNRVVEIRAEKTGGWKNGLWYHPFKPGSEAQLLALDNGDLLVHSKTGKKLWRTD